MEVIKSVYNSDIEILTSIQKLYLNNKQFDLDPCYSKGNFYKEEQCNFFTDNIITPKIKMDKNPQYPDVIQNNILNGIPLNDNSIESIIFDPPFMFGKHGKTDNNIMCKRFTMFDNWQQLANMYKKSLSEFYRILKKNGIIAFKCQDYTDSITTLTHHYVYIWAIEQGFYAEDIFILLSKNRIWNSLLKQKHARKFHSYWYVFCKTQKRKSKVN